MKVESSSITEKLNAMEVLMGTKVTFCLVGTKTTHGDPKELDEAKGASGTVDLGVEDLIAHQVNE